MLNLNTLNKSLSNKEWVYFQCPNPSADHNQNNNKFHISPTTGVGKCWSCADYKYTATKEELEQIKSLIPDLKDKEKELNITERLLTFDTIYHYNWKDAYCNNISISNKYAILGYQTFCDYISNRGISILDSNKFIPDIKFQHSFYQHTRNLQEWDEDSECVDELLLVVNKDNFIYKYRMNDIKDTKAKGLSVKQAVAGSVIEPFYFNDIRYNPQGEPVKYYIFEGLEDSLAFIELYFDSIDLTKSIFVVTFGCTNFSKITINTPECEYFFCLDNDKDSKKYFDIFKNKNSKNISLYGTKIKGYVPNEEYKDFNQQLNNSSIYLCKESLLITDNDFYKKGDNLLRMKEKSYVYGELQEGYGVNNRVTYSYLYNLITTDLVLKSTINNYDIKTLIISILQSENTIEMFEINYILNYYNTRYCFKNKRFIPDYVNNWESNIQETI
jgi:hypothetical protein